MEFKWTPELSVGHAKLDQEHKEIQSRINELNEAICSNRTADLLFELFDSLKRDVAGHLHAERLLMHEHPNLIPTAHEQQYLELLRICEVLKGTYELKGPSSAVVVDLQRALGQWLIRHVHLVDMEFADYLHAQRVRESTRVPGLVGADARSVSN